MEQDIKHLKQHLEQVQQERDAAYEQVDRWCNLYAIEAQQRRTETRLASERIAQLEAEVERLKGGYPSQPEANSPEATAAIDAELAALNSFEACKTKLRASLQERDRLYDALIREQYHHAQTRESLLEALTETIKYLSSEGEVAP